MSIDSNYLHGLIASLPLAMSNAVACDGIQHRQLTSLGNDDAARSFCGKKWTYIGGAWRSKQCSLVIDSNTPKQRCAKCATAYHNIRPSRYPILFPDRVVAKEDTTEIPEEQSKLDRTLDTTHIAQLIFSDETAVRCRLLKLTKARVADKDADLFENEEIVLAVKALKLKGHRVFDPDDER